MGVNDDVMIIWKDTFRPNDVKEFDKGIITFPCFDASVLWIEVEEEDSYIVDKAQVAVACQNLQIGMNEIVIHVEENGTGVSVEASILKTIFGTTFNFGHSNDNKIAQYTFTLDVRQNCSLLLDQNNYTRNANVPGNVKFYSQNIETVLIPKMEAEFIPLPKPEEEESAVEEIEVEKPVIIEEEEDEVIVIEEPEVIEEPVIVVEEVEEEPPVEEPVEEPVIEEPIIEEPVVEEEPIEEPVEEPIEEPIIEEEPVIEEEPTEPEPI